MNGQENLDQVPKSNDTPEDVNENVSREQAIEELQTQSENMEVHHHPDLHHRKKHWNEYFLEFIIDISCCNTWLFCRKLPCGVIKYLK